MIRQVIVDPFDAAMTRCRVETFHGRHSWRLASDTTTTKYSMSVQEMNRILDAEEAEAHAKRGWFERRFHGRGMPMLPSIRFRRWATVEHHEVWYCIHCALLVERTR